MDVETFITAVFCLADDFVRDLRRAGRLRRRGPAPVLADSEVLAIEAAGEFLGLDTDQALHAYFRRHFGHLFPGLRTVHRTTLARQAANLWLVKRPCGGTLRRQPSTMERSPSSTACPCRSAALPALSVAEASAGWPPSDATRSAHQTYYGCACTCGSRGPA
jgi:hypothetical protein